MKKKVAILALSLFLPSMAFAATDTYRTGSMIFHFAAGTSMPGFIHFFGDAEGLDSDYWLWGEDDHATKLNWGGNFSLGFERFTSRALAENSGMTSTTVSMTTCSPQFPSSSS